MFDASRAFLAALREGEPPSLTQLSELLDALASAYHLVPLSEPADIEADRPSRFDEWKEWMLVLGKRFPELGYYRRVDPLAEPPDDLFLEDAIDDLADIALDLEDFLWRAENLGTDDANWHVRFSFESHWGSHLRGLTSYLHAKQFYG
jgi:hypothetical protein